MLLVQNRRATHDYTIKETWEAGIVLTGAEVKSVRAKHASLNGAYVKIFNLEVWLINATISPYRFANDKQYDPKRTRKLLLTKKQVYELIDLSQIKGLTIIPLSLFLQNNCIKVKIGAGKGKKEYEKRSILRQREIDRQLAKEYKERR